MISKDINACQQPLINAYNSAVKQWKVLYKDSPQPFLTCTTRDIEDQYTNYGKGRTKEECKKAGVPEKYAQPDLKPVTWTMHSKHLEGKAFDVAFKTSTGILDWSPELFINFWHLIHTEYPEITWGGTWKSSKDLPHFEIK